MIEDPKNPSTQAPSSSDKNVKGAIAVLDSRMGKEDEEILKRMKDIRKRLTGTFRKEVLVGKLKEIISAATFVRFADERAKRFLDPRRPVLRLKIRMNEACFQNFPNPKLELLLKSTETITVDPETKEGRVHIELFMTQKLDVLQAEIMEPFLTFMFEELQKLQEASEEVKKELEVVFALMPDVKDLKQFLLPSIFRVMADPTKAERVQLEYLS